MGAALRRRRPRAVRHDGGLGPATPGCPVTGTSPARPSRGSRPPSRPTDSGAIRYYDAQVDDARLVITIARTAAAHGAHVATRVKVTGFLREGERVIGAGAVDLEDGRELEVRARVVVNAAGVWTDEIQDMVGGRGSLHVQASKGIHLVVPRDRIRSEAGFIVRTETSVLFVIPWGRHWIIGTTDTPWDLDKAHPAASRADVDYVLDHVNAILREPLDHEDVEGVYAGLRPLLSGESEPTSRISREHTVVTPVPGLVMIAGGKLTTYRVMARDAVDAAAHSLTTSGAAVRDSITHRVPLLGADGYETRSNQRVHLARRSGLHVARIDHLLGRYGDLVDDLLALIEQRPELAEPLVGRRRLPRGRGRLRRHPRGRPPPRRRAHPPDPDLYRDLRPWRRGRAAGGAALMAAELGWDDAAVADEVDHYLRRVEAERQTPDDADRPGGRRGPGQRSRHRLTHRRWLRCRGSPATSLEASCTGAGTGSSAGSGRFEARPLAGLAPQPAMCVGASASLTRATSGGSGTASGRNQRNARFPRG